MYTRLSCRGANSVYQALVQGSYQCVPGSREGEIPVCTRLSCRGATSVYQALVQGSCQCVPGSLSGPAQEPGNKARYVGI